MNFISDEGILGIEFFHKFLHFARLFDFILQSAVVGFEHGILEENFIQIQERIRCL